MFFFLVRFDCVNFYQQTHRRFSITVSLIINLYQDQRMNTQIFYRRVEIFKCVLLGSILIVLVLIFLKLPTQITVKDLKDKQTSLTDLPVVVIKDGRITLENKEIQVKGSVRIDEQPVEVIERKSSYRW